MTNVFKVNNISIVKKKNNFELNIKKKHNYSPYLFDSLKLSENLTVLNEMKCLESGNCKMTFKAQNVLSLHTLISRNYLDYNQLAGLFLNIKNQILFLKTQGIGILFLSINDVVFIESNNKFCFLFLNVNNLYEIEDNNIIVSNSFEKKNKNNFLSPELLNINSIPFEVDYRCVFYSLSNLIAFCIKGQKLDIFKPIDWEYDDYKSILEPIDNTKLYWALLRAHEINPYDRYLLWI